MSRNVEIVPDLVRVDTEPQPKTFVFLHGFEHAGINVAGVAPIIQTIRDAFSKTQGEKTLYLEEAVHSRSQAAETARDRMKGGFRRYVVRAVLGNERGNEPLDFVVNDRIASLDTKEDSEVIDGIFVPPQNLLEYFLYRELDIVRSESDFRLRIEGHSGRTTGQIRSYVDEMEISQEEFHSNWKNGRFFNSLDAYKARYQVRKSLGRIRDPEIEQELKEEVNKFQKAGGGALVGVFGFNHIVPLTDFLQRKFRSEVRVVSNIIAPEGIQEALIDNMLRNNELVTDVLYAQSMFMKIALSQIYAVFIRNKRLSAGTLAYHEISTELVRIAYSFSLEEIREICEQGTLVSTVLNHPLAPTTRGILE